MNTRPPQPGSAEHWQQWLERYGSDYDTDIQRQAAYADAVANLADLNAVFGTN